MDKFFEITKRGSTFKTEIFGGITTFFAMAYIVFVNPNQVAGEGSSGWLAQAVGDATVSAQLGQIWNAVFVASILAAIIGTLLMAFYAKMPYAQACGMGLNAFFCTVFVAGAALGGTDVIDGYHAGMVLVFLSGIVFLILSITGARDYIAKAMPVCLKKAIPAGIGLFIALVGLKGSGLIVENEYTIVSFIDIHGAVLSGEYSSIISALTAFVGLIFVAVLAKKDVKGAVILGIIFSTVVYYALSQTVPTLEMESLGQTFRDFSEISITGLFSATAWEDAFYAAPVGGIFNAIMLIITFCLVDMFDTVGTLYGTATRANMLDKNGDPERMNQCMLCDSIATTVGAAIGTSTCTTFVESSAGVAAGARTGLASLVTAICFALCLFLSPLASIIPTCATAPALIYVGVLMAKSFGTVDMDDLASAVPAFLALIMMPLTYSIANGIGIGAIAYVLIQLFTGNYKKRDIVVTIIALMFSLKFFFVTM